MPSPTIAVPVGLGLLSSRSSSKAAQSAADTQAQASIYGIDKQDEARRRMEEILKPYVEAGTGAIGQMGQYAEAGLPALEQQLTFAGLRGADAQRAAIEGISNSPEMQAMLQQGENAMLQNASATGGLRGGNLQGALAQYRPGLLAGLLDKQYARLGGLSNMGLATQGNIAQLGQASAAGVGSAGMQSANSISQLLAQQGAANAGNALAQGRAQQGMFGALEKGWGIYQGMQNPSSRAPGWQFNPSDDGFSTNPFGGV